jgi:hypothetical protein
MRRVTISEAALEFVRARGRILAISEQVYLVG